jgi:hypothetical protein
MTRLIIALLSLLLIAATPTPLPRHHHQARKAKAVEEKNHANSSPISSPSYQPSPEPTAATSRNYTYNYYNPPSKPESPPVWFQVATTVVLIFFTGGLWLTSFWQWRAIADQTEISKRALTQLEVPYVSIGKIIPHVLQSSGTPAGPKPWAVIWFEFALKNHGRSVAEVTSVHSELRILEVLPMPPEYAGIIEQSTFPIGPNSASGDVKWTATYKFPDGKIDEEFWSLLGGKQQLVCFAYIRYADSLKNTWISGFCWRWNPHNDGANLSGGCYYNYNRKDEPYTGLSEPEYRLA